MCGILGFFDPNGAFQGSPEDLKARLRTLSARQKTRGPDGCGQYGGKNWCLSHQRLSIMDPEGGHQPIVYEEEGYALVVNGEIYNHLSLIEKHGITQKMQSQSDSEPVIALFKKLGPQVCNELNGMYAFIVTSEDGKQVCAARDHCGIIPLYYGVGKNGERWFASELKCIFDQCEFVEEFPPGHYWTPESGFVKYYNPEWDSDDYVPTDGVENIRQVLEQAVRDQLAADVDFGLLMSGGLDSAVVAVTMKPILEQMGREFHTFTVGQEGSPDIKAARIMSQYLGTIHHECTFNADEAFDNLEKIIYHLETYEPESIRAAIPNFFLDRLAAQHVKMVLTGEGADELFGGHNYFKDAPDSQAFQKELRRVFHHLHNGNNQRADRMSMANGLEARVPFLDPNVIDAIMKIDPEHKEITPFWPTEKYALRAAFKGTMPDSILCRKQTMQCEGIGNTWLSELQNRCNMQISDEDFEKRNENFPINTPKTKEEMYYRMMFDKHFKGMDKFVQVWEEGSRAGDAVWKQSKISASEGQKDLKQLAKGLKIDTSMDEQHSTESGSPKSISTK